MNLSYLDLKELRDDLILRLAGKEFHTFTTRFVKNWRLRSNFDDFGTTFEAGMGTLFTSVTADLVAWKCWSAAKEKKLLASTLSIPWTILNIWIMSPLSLRAARVGRFKVFSFSC